MISLKREEERVGEKNRERGGETCREAARGRIG